MIALVAIAVSAVGWLSYRNLEQALLQRARDRIETHSRQIATDLEYYAASATGDVAGFRSAVALHGLVRARKAGGTDPIDGVSEKTWRDRIASRLAAELEAKPSYAMFRIIGVDDGGRELVRVDRNGPNGAVRIVPEEGMQKRGDRDYFRETIRLGPTANLRLTARSRPLQRTDRGGAPADGPRRDADLRKRRKTVRHFHGQCRHAARVRPRPVIGVAGRDVSMSSTGPATISFIRTARANSARCSAGPTIGRPTSRIWRRRLGQSKAARTSFWTRLPGPAG